MALRGVWVLQEELEKAKESLKGVDENIKKLTGRDPTDGRGPPRRVSREDPRGGMGRGRIFGVARRSLTEEASPVANRRHSGGSAFGRLGPRVAASRLRPNQRQDSGDEEEPSRRPAVQSSVVATPVDIQTRQDKLEEQSKDGAGRQRNRRMFGLLLGTLQRFKDEEKLKVDKVQQRKAIENKLEEKAREEREELKKERMTLFNDRRAKQAKLRRLEQKLELVDIHAEWEQQTQQLMHFIRTKAKPPIYYLPRSHTSATEKRKEDTSKILEEIIEDRRKQLEEEIEELTKEQESKADTRDDDHEMDVSREEREDEMEEEEEEEEQGGGESPSKDAAKDQRVVHMEAGEEEKENGDDKEGDEESGEREGKGKEDAIGVQREQAGEEEEEGRRGSRSGDQEGAIAEKTEQDEPHRDAGKDREVESKREGGDSGRDHQETRESRRERKRSRKDSSRSTEGREDKSRDRQDSPEREGGSRHKKSRDHSEERQRAHDRKERKKRRKEKRKGRSSSASEPEDQDRAQAPRDQPEERSAEKAEVASSEAPVPVDSEVAAQMPQDIELPPTDARNVVGSAMEEGK